MRGGITRIDFGTDPLGPASNNHFFNSSSLYYSADIDIVKDDLSGDWYGFVYANGNIVRMDFGKNLGNDAPSLTVLTATKFMVSDLNVKKISNNWLILGIGLESQVFRMNLGASITNASPVTAVFINDFSWMQHRFVIHEDHGVWYMLIADAGGISKATLGGSPDTGIPVFQRIKSLWSNYLFNGQSIMLFSDCDSIVAYVLDDWGEDKRLHFGTTMADTPIITDIDYINRPLKPSNPFLYNGKLYAVGIDQSNTGILELITLPAGSSIISGTKSLTHTFIDSGRHTISIACDLASASGSKTFCKDVYVRIQPKVSVYMVGDSLIASASAAGYQWNLNGLPISGATNHSYHPDTTGRYSVTITDQSACTATSADVKFTVGVVDVKAEGVNLYPNPSTGLVSISMGDAKSEQVKLRCYSTIGALVYSLLIQAVNGSCMVNLSHLPKGMYEVQLSTEDGTTSRKRLVLE